MQHIFNSCFISPIEKKISVFLSLLLLKEPQVFIFLKSNSYSYGLTLISKKIVFFLYFCGIKYTCILKTLIFLGSVPWAGPSGGGSGHTPQQQWTPGNGSTCGTWNGSSPAQRAWAANQASVDRMSLSSGRKRVFFGRIVIHLKPCI